MVEVKRTGERPTFELHEDGRRIFDWGTARARALRSVVQFARDEKRNPDWFRDAYGRPHPIRSSPGYDGALERLRKGDKAYLRKHSDQPRKGYTQESRGRAARVAEHRDYQRALASLSPAERRSVGLRAPRLPSLTYQQRQAVDDQRFKPRRKKAR